LKNERTRQMAWHRNDFRGMVRGRSENPRVRRRASHSSVVE
jgi:hypothetical protein